MSMVLPMTSSHMGLSLGIWYHRNQFLGGYPFYLTMLASQYMSGVEIGSSAYGILYKVHDLHSGHFMAFESPQ